MEKLKMHTPNLTEEKFKKLAEMFPNAVTEILDENGNPVRVIDADVLRQEISADVVEGPKERYQFTWPDKKKSVILANQPIARTLRLNREKSVGRDGSAGSIDTENIYIEGDNLEALKLLQETYLGKIKLIYIDPPYNTGSDAFVYDDDSSISAEEFSERSGQRDEDGNLLFDFRQNSESNGRFHTDWLNMMYPRLRLAKDLLSEDGVIFISIDDNEVENLKKVCNEIFGANNFVAQLVWEKKKKGSFLAKAITNIKEYIIIYAKRISAFAGLIGELNSEVMTYPCINAVNNRDRRHIPAGIKSNYSEGNYSLPAGTIISDTTMNIVLHSDLVIKDGVLAEDLDIEGNWRYSQEAMYQYAIKGELYITRDLYLRRIVSETRMKTMKDLLPRVGDNIEGSYNDLVDENDLFSSGWGSNEDADEELRIIMGTQKIFDYPKPTKLILKLLIAVRDKNLIILDFFSGSATTAHAVMKLNAEDGGVRKFIMIQAPEICNENSEAYRAGYKDVCEIGEERIRRAGKKIKEESPLTTNDLDIGFRVFYVDDSNMKEVYYNPAKLEYDQIELYSDNIKPDRTPEDLLFQVMLDLGIPLSSKIEKQKIDGKDVFSVEEGYLIACFDSDIKDKTVTEIAKKKPYYAVFRDSGMADDSVITNFEQIFETYSPDTKRKVI